MFSLQVDKDRDRAKEVWVVYRSVQKCTIQVYRVVRSCDHRDLSRNSLLTMRVCPMKRLKRLRRNLLRLRKSLMKLAELNLKSITELSDLVIMGICPVKILWPWRFVQWRNYYKWWNKWRCQNCHYWSFWAWELKSPRLQVSKWHSLFVLSSFVHWGLIKWRSGRKIWFCWRW